MYEVRSLPAWGLALLLPLSGCMLVGYDLSSDSNTPGGGNRADGGSSVSPPASGTQMNDGGGNTGTGTGDGSTAGAGGSGGSSGSSGGGSGSGGAGGPRDAGVANDSGATGGTGGGAGSNPCQGMPDGTLCNDGLYCQIGDQCMGGVCRALGPKPCYLVGGLCNIASCDEANDTCLFDPVPNGTSCDNGQVCAEGECTEGQDCGGSGSSCDLACPSGSAPCSFDCSQASSCTVGCDLGSTCAVDCSGADTCGATCSNADCAIDCSNANTCSPLCSGGTCQIDCRGATDCESIVCAQGATCVALCDPGQAGEGCDFFICASGAPLECPDNVIVCNGQCSSWTWRRDGYSWRH